MAKSKMVNCKACGAEIADSAKACPSCGAKNKKPIFKKWWFWAIIVILVIGIAGGSSGGSNEPEKVGEIEASASSPAASEPVTTEFSVGDIVELNDIVVTLTDVSENNGSQFFTPTEGNVFVICEFEIENNSSADIAVSSMLSFEAYVDDYATSMSLSAMMSVDTAQLDGTVAAGKKMHGVIGYEVPANWSNIEVRYTPDFWAGKEIIFSYEK